jgi:regulator of RNase E activity RraA
MPMSNDGQDEASAAPISISQMRERYLKLFTGEVIVNPGDWIFGDVDGIVAVPRKIASDVLLAAEQIMNKEVTIKDWVRGGMKPSEVVARGGYF